MDRRRFIKSLGLGTGAVLWSGVPWARRAAASAADRNFVFAYFSGGWDLLLSLDPRDPAVFTQARVGQTGIELAWDRLPDGVPRTIHQPAGSNIGFGPVMGPVAPHFDQICVVRGMSMDTVTHEVGRRYFLTGMMPRGTLAAGSSMGTRLSAQQGDLRPIPSLVSRVESYNENDPSFATGLVVASATDLVGALTTARDTPAGAVGARLAAFRDRRTLCDPGGLDGRGLLTLLGESQRKARDLVASGIGRRFAFNNLQDAEIVALRTRYGITNNNLTSSAAQAALTFQALRHGIAQCVTVELARGLDTHGPEWATDQPARLTEGFTALGQLIQDLKDTDHPDGNGRLIERTTVVVFSEFGRTPRLNNREGRDHWLTAACLLIGRGVPHNRVIGASTDVGLGPQAIDPVTGLVAASGGVIPTPNNVLASILAGAGFDTQRLRTSGLPCLMA